LRKHQWDEHEWDVQQVGFDTDFIPKYYTPERVASSFCACPQVPKFHMVLKKHRIQYQDCTSSSQAFSTIIKPSGSVPQLIPIIKEVTNKTKEYVAFQMRRTNPDAFQGAIRYQNHILVNQLVVLINNLGMDAMYSVLSN
jgi:hypothetical protein